MKYLVFSLMLLNFFGCSDQTRDAFVRGCNKMYDKFNNDRAQKNLPAIEESLSCDKRFDSKIKGSSYHNQLKTKDSKAVEIAGCGFAVSSYISNYYEPFSSLNIKLALAVNAGDYETAKFTNEFCKEVGLSSEDYIKN